MSNVCCKELKGWCKSFTKTEIFLCVLQTIFSVIFITLLTFLILHLVVCLKIEDYLGSPDHNSKIKAIDDYMKNDNVTATERDIMFKSSTNQLQNDTTVKKIIFNTIVSTNSQKFVDQSGVTLKEDIVKDNKVDAVEENTVTVTNEIVKANTVTTKEKIVKENKLPTPAGTFNKGLSCTWQPSKKTEAFIHYYEHGSTSKVTVIQRKKTAIENESLQFMQLFNHEEESQLQDNKLLEDTLDGEHADNTEKSYLLALVKMGPPQDLTFGCTLTIVSEYWTLTAASCIEAIEEVDSLDYFVMMQDIGAKSQDSTHQVVDVMIHPQYQGINVTYDLAALKSNDNLVKHGNSIVMLPTMLDYFLITIGERLTILGHGRFRNTEKELGSRVVRRVRVQRVPAAQCARGPGGRPGCAGAARARGAACGYCAGTPLLRRRALLGVRAGARPRGAACGPALYVNLAVTRDWLDSVFESN